MVAPMEPDYIRAHAHATNNRAELAASEACGCFYCLSIFEPREVCEWVDVCGGEGTTALCPRCGIDAVIGSTSGFPITRPFLEEMHQYWF
jgi:hypothetical protein